MHSFERTRMHTKHIIYKNITNIQNRILTIIFGGYNFPLKFHTFNHVYRDIYICMYIKITNLIITIHLCIKKRKRMEELVSIEFRTIYMKEVGSWYNIRRKR